MFFPDACSDRLAVDAINDLRQAYRTVKNCGKYLFCITIYEREGMAQTVRTPFQAALACFGVQENPTTKPQVEKNSGQARSPMVKITNSIGFIILTYNEQGIA
jgi:hypothetical protein